MGPLSRCTRTHHRCHCVKAWRHLQNRKHTTYCSATRGGLNYGHYIHEIWWSSAAWFRPTGFSDMRSDGQTDKQTYSSQFFAPFSRTSKVITSSPPKSFGKSRVAIPHGIKWTRSLRVLSVQCPPHTSPVTQPGIRHVHNAVPLRNSA